MGVIEQFDNIFFGDNLDFNGQSILEVGSRVVNYNLKEKLSERFNNFSFLGIDIIPGDGVDKILDICDYDYDERKYDSIFSLTALEHVADWIKAVSNIKKMLKTGGRVLIIVPSIWPVHLFPIDCWRFSEENLIDIFSDFHIEKIEHMIQTPGKEECIFMRARKMSLLSSVNLENIKVQAIELKNTCPE